MGKCSIRRKRKSERAPFPGLFRLVYTFCMMIFSFPRAICVLLSCLKLFRLESLTLFCEIWFEIAVSKLWHQRISRLKTGETEAQKYLQHYWPAYPLHFHHACRMEYKMDLFFLNFALAIVWHQFWPDFAEVVGGKTCHHFTVAIFQKKNCCWP